MRRCEVALARWIASRSIGSKLNKLINQSQIIVAVIKKRRHLHQARCSRIEGFKSVAIQTCSLALAQTLEWFYKSLSAAERQKSEMLIKLSFFYFKLLTSDYPVPTDSGKQFC